jgi:hypothetical protein
LPMAGFRAILDSLWWNRAELIRSQHVRSTRCLLF